MAGVVGGAGGRDATLVLHGPLSESDHRHRRVAVSIFWEMPPILSRSSLKRCVPWLRFITTRTDHLSPTRDRISLTARQSAGRCGERVGFIEVTRLQDRAFL